MLRALPLLLAAACAGTSCDGDDGGQRPEPAPPWDWRDAIVYQLLTDRFANGDAANDLGADPLCNTCYHGGDWAGIIDHLDYLAALGVNALWISPVCENADSPIGSQAYHGYWPRALDQPNPHFGDAATLHALLDAAHARGMKVIADLVLNHLGPVAYYDINENGALDAAGAPGSPGHELSPPYNAAGVLNGAGTDPAPFVWLEPPADGVSPASFADPTWFHRRGQILDFNDAAQSLTGDFRGGLRDLATERPEVRAALSAVALEWLAGYPFDGFRIDAAKHVDNMLWEEALPAWRQAFRAREERDDGLMIVAEVFDGNVSVLAEHSTRFDSLLNFAAKYRAVDDVFKYGGPTTRLEQFHLDKESSLRDTPHANGLNAPPSRVLFNFLDNHDMPRFLFDKPDARVLRLALAYLFGSDGIPVVYYGTEAELAGGMDPANREDLGPTGFAQGGETFTWIAALANARAAHEALRRGDTRFVFATTHVGDEIDAGMVAWERFTASERVLVVLNTSDHVTAQTVSGGNAMQVGFAPGTRLTAVVATSSLPPLDVGADGTVVVTLPPLSAAFFAPAG